MLKGADFDWSTIQLTTYFFARGTSAITASKIENHFDYQAVLKEIQKESFDFLKVALLLFP